MNHVEYDDFDKGLMVKVITKSNRNGFHNMMWNTGY